jgi:hypothetical protein
MLPNTYHKVWKDLGLINFLGSVSILGWCGRSMRMVLLELVYLTVKVVIYVILFCERHSTVLHLLLKLLRLHLHVLDFHVLRSLELLKLIGPNLGGLLGHLQKDMLPN